MTCVGVQLEIQCCSLVRAIKMILIMDWIHVAYQSEYTCTASEQYAVPVNIWFQKAANVAVFSQNLNNV